MCITLRPQSSPQPAMRLEFFFTLFYSTCSLFLQLQGRTNKFECAKKNLNALILPDRLRAATIKNIYKLMNRKIYLVFIHLNNYTSCTIFILFLRLYFVFVAWFLMQFKLFLFYNADLVAIAVEFNSAICYSLRFV